MKDLIEKLKKCAKNDNIKLCIVGIIEQMLLAAPECVQYIVDNEKGVEGVYNKLRAMKSGTDKDILKTIKDVYKMPVDFEMEMKIVRKDTSKKNEEQKIIDLFDFI